MADVGGYYGPDIPPATVANNPLYPNVPTPAATAVPGTSGSGGTGSPGADVQINPPTIPGGPFEGWISQDFDKWHQGAGFGQLGYPSFEGRTAGPGGQPLAYETTSYDVPGFGWVPRAQLANQQASNNLWDYMNPFGHTSQGGPGTGDVTQRNVGRFVGTLSNLGLPGSGFLTGPFARWITSLIQHGASPSQVKAAVQQVRSGSSTGGGGSVSVGPFENVTGNAPSGSSLDPYGNAVSGREWWSSDFGRGTGGPNAPGGYNLAGPGGGFGQRGTGFGSGTVGNWYTALGFGGNLGGSAVTNPSALGGDAYSRHLLNLMGQSYAGQKAAGIETPMWGGTRLLNPGAFGASALGGDRGSRQAPLRHWNPKATD